MSDDGNDDLIEVHLDTSFKPLYRSSITGEIKEIIRNDGSNQFTNCIVSGKSYNINRILNEYTQKYENAPADNILSIHEDVKFELI